MPYAIGTDLAHMGGKSIVSTIRHGKFGNVDIKLGISMILGTTAGMELGARLVMKLEHLGVADSVIRKIYVVFLAFIGSYVLYDYISHVRSTKRAAAKCAPAPKAETLAQRMQRRVRIHDVVVRQLLALQHTRRRHGGAVDARRAVERGAITVLCSLVGKSHEKNPAAIVRSAVSADVFVFR